MGTPEATLREGLEEAAISRLPTATSSQATPALCPQPSCPPSWGPTLFVWVLWLVSFGSVLVFIGCYGADSPLYDDWEYVPALTGDQPLTWAWLWSQTNEHRMPVQKLILLASYKLTGNDFRAGMFFNAFALGTLAFALILAAGRLRGWTSYADALLPLALLNLGQSENLLWSYQVQFICSTVLAGILLLIVLGRNRSFTLGTTLLAGICLLLLPLCGSNGLAFVPAFSVWLGYCGIHQLRSPSPWTKATGVGLLTFASAAVLLVALYFVGYAKPAHHPASPDRVAALTTSVQFLSMSLGLWAATQWWPVSGLTVLALVLVSVACLLLVWRQQPSERLRASGLLLFLVALVCLALGLGWGRAGLGPDSGFASRYQTLAVPLLVCIYFTWATYGPPAVSRLVQLGLFGLMCVSYALTASPALAWGRAIRAQQDAFQRDLAARVPLSVLADCHGHLYIPGEPAAPKAMARWLRMLHRAGIGPFRALEEHGIVREVPFPPDTRPVEANQMTRKDGFWVGSGDDPYLVFALKGAQEVYAIRLTFAYEDTPSPAVFQVFWRRSDQQGFTEAERNFALELDTGAGERTVTVPVRGTIDEFRIDPDTKPCGFKLSGMVLLVPAPAAPAVASGLEGTLDVVDVEAFAGWVWDPKQPNMPLTVGLYEEERLLATALADQFREDLIAAGKGDGRHAFRIPTPMAIKDGKPHVVRVRVVGMPFELDESPRKVTLTSR
jgi:hypothetical protein